MIIFLTTTVTRKLDTCCRRVITFFLWYLPHKGTWVLTWKFTMRYKQHNTPLVLRVCHLMTKCLVNYKLWKFYQEVYNSFWKNTSKRESKDIRIKKLCVSDILPRAPIYTSSSIPKGHGHLITHWWSSIMTINQYHYNYGIHEHYSHY